VGGFAAQWFTVSWSPVMPLRGMGGEPSAARPDVRENAGTVWAGIIA